MTNEIDEIAEVVREARDRNDHAAIEQRLIDAGVVAEALLGLEARRAVGRIVELEQCRRLGAGACAGVEFGAGLGNRIGRRRAPGLEARDVHDVVDPAAEGDVQPLADRQLPQREHRIGVLRLSKQRTSRPGDRQHIGRVGVGGLVLGLCEPTISEPSGSKLQIALIFGAGAVADEIGNDRRGILRQLVGPVGHIVERNDRCGCRTR